MNKKTKIIVIILCYLLGLFVCFYIIDSFVFPSITRDRDVVIVPNINGKSFGEAKRILSSYDLEIEVIKEIYSEKHKIGAVTSQLPKENSKVKSGRAIFVTISKGKELVPVPYITGLNLRNARLSLMRSGLELGEITYAFSEDVPKDMVVSQSRKPGGKIAYGEKINLVVSKGAEDQIKVPNLIGKRITEAQKLLMESNLVLGKIDFRTEETYLPELIIEQDPLQGELVDKDTPVNIIVTK